MPDAISSPPTIARLIAPRIALASCLRAIVERSTLGCALPPDQRLNRYPATPFCGITLLFEGELALVQPAIEGAVLRPRQALFFGPHTMPTISGSPGEVHFMTLMFFPDAMHRLTGIDMAGMMDQMLPMEQVLDAGWQAMAAAVFAAADAEARTRIVEDFLEPRWQASRQPELAAGVTDWVRGLAVRAAAAGLGRSARMAERRIRAWAGQPMRSLRRIHRAEQSFFEARAELLHGKVSWSDVAARGGYADQAHLSREARQITGLPPSEFARLSLTDESFWVYRIWN
ncbi:helix-turn-helix domain-containing protein [Massilia sp. SM-13]|uniref:helix-turn-helix domain-containing protein n=1 Tax=Pseudoduganella rhizocola TaxID=3382643 RepID=UPI0038B5FB32